MWPAWGYDLWALLPGVCVRRTLPLLGPVALGAAALLTSRLPTRCPTGCTCISSGTEGVF